VQPHHALVLGALEHAHRAFHALHQPLGVDRQRQHGGLAQREHGLPQPFRQKRRVARIELREGQLDRIPRRIALLLRQPRSFRRAGGSVAVAALVGGDGRIRLRHRFRRWPRGPEERREAQIARELGHAP
jgi:hypothetical protein